METNKIYCENCIETMNRMPDKFVDIVITSPPYDNLRDYQGYSFDFESIAKNLNRIMKDGGVIIWVVKDQVINGSESGTSFRQALYFINIGFNLHDTMIYEKNNTNFLDTIRYYDSFEFMFVFSKGKPKTINLIADRKNNEVGRKMEFTDRRKDGSLKKRI